MMGSADGRLLLLSASAVLGGMEEMLFNLTAALPALGVTPESSACRTASSSKDCVAQLSRSKSSKLADCIIPSHGTGWTASPPQCHRRESSPCHEVPRPRYGDSVGDARCRDASGDQLYCFRVGRDPAHRAACGPGDGIGLPVVAVHTDGPRDISDHNVTGLVYPSRPPLTSANASGQLLDSSDRRQQISVAARAHVEGAFYREVMAQRLLEIVAGGLRRPSVDGTFEPGSGTADTAGKA